MDFYAFFGHEFGNGLRIDADVRLAVGYEDHVLVPGRSRQAFGGEKKPFADIRSRKSGYFLPDGIGGNLREYRGKRADISRQRAEKKRLSGEYHESEPVAITFRDEIREHPLGRFQSVGGEVFREHGFGNVEHEHDVGAFFRFRLFDVRISRIGRKYGQ